jgi:hypothetical protein
VRITIDNGPLWIQYVIGIATAAAAVFAAWAALSARSAARATQDLVRVESARDDRLERDALWRQARRVTIDLLGQPVALPDDRAAHDMHVTLTNSSADPITKARLKLIVGDATWGPQLLGTIGPWQQVRLTARLITSDSSDNANAFLRFLDVEARPWVANARSAVEPDSLTVGSWIDEGKQFARRTLSAEERGTIEGSGIPPDSDDWRTDMASRQGEAYSPDEERPPTA